MRLDNYLLSVMWEKREGRKGLGRFVLTDDDTMMKGCLTGEDENISRRLADCGGITSESGLSKSIIWQNTE